MYTLLFVDDDIDVLNINRKFFEEKQCEIYICSDATEAEKLVHLYQPDCILLDVMMEGMNGYALCRKIREFSQIPILFLSGKTSEEHKIHGFECGADDYIEKPYSLKELYVRIIANIKRYQGNNNKAEKGIIQLNRLNIDVIGHKVYCDETEVCLSNREYELLCMLAKTPNQLITFEEIGMAMWGTYAEDDRRSVMVNVSRLRKKLDTYSGIGSMIETVWSKGYKLKV